MATRKTFPTSGIYRTTETISDSNYCNDNDAKRYRYLLPADYVQPQNSIGDCWIVDAQGNVNPGTDVSPVPFCREMIGRRISA